MPAFVSVACCVTCRISEREMLCQLLSRIYHHFIRARNVTSVFGLHNLRNLPDVNEWNVTSVFAFHVARRTEH